MHLPLTLKKQVKLGVVAALLCTSSWSAQATECSATYFDGTDKPLPKTILWQVDSDATGTDYLFGTFHSSQKAVLDKLARLNKIGGQLDGIALELLLSDPNTTQVIQQATLLPPTMRLSDLIGDDLFMRTMHAMRPYGLGMQQIEYIRPWAAALTLSMPSSEVLSNNKVLDEEIERLGKNANKEVVALETAQEQMSIFASLNIEEQKIMLEETLDIQDQLPAIYSRMTSLYVQEDISGLQSFSDELEAQAKDKEFYSRLMDKLLDKRNDLMVKRMLPIMKSARIMVAVGALHLTTDDGLLARLEKAGYCLTPLEQ